MQVVDASWYMPDEQRNPIQEYQVLTLKSSEQLDDIWHYFNKFSYIYFSFD